VRVLYTIRKGLESWHEKLRSTSKYMEWASDGLVFVDINVQEGLGYDLTLL